MGRSRNLPGMRLYRGSKKRLSRVRLRDYPPPSELIVLVILWIIFIVAAPWFGSHGRIIDGCSSRSQARRSSPRFNCEKFSS
jgi:hypothetical protein